jgi:protein-disulfide isomerase
MQGKFWPMHSLIFKNQKSISQSKLENFARQIGLNFKKFKSDMNSAKVKEMVAMDRKEGEMAELTGTPTIFINGRRYLGEPDNPAALSQAFDEALKAAAADTGDSPKDGAPADKPSN